MKLEDRMQGVPAALLLDGWWLERRDPAPPVPVIMAPVRPRAEAAP